jgi:hypothetical protein
LKLEGVVVVVVVAIWNHPVGALAVHEAAATVDDGGVGLRLGFVFTVHLCGFGSFLVVGKFLEFS